MSGASSAGVVPKSSRMGVPSIQMPTASTSTSFATRRG
jgi:hypothetical protein